MASRQYFSFIGSVFDFFSEQDKSRMGEYWQGLEQVFASVYQKYIEAHLGVAVNDMLSYTTERWLPYVFDSTTQVQRFAVVTGTQDLSVGLRLSDKYLLRFSWDSNPPVELDLRGINALATTIDEIKTRINNFVGFPLVRGIFQNTILQFTSPTKGVSSSITFYETSDPTKNAIEFVMGILAVNLPQTSPQFPYTYSIPYTKVVQIPSLQDHIRQATEDDLISAISVSLILNIDTDYILEANNLISFAAQPPAAMWAKRTLIDEETPWNNFGFLMDIYEPNTPEYLSVIQGLWFAFWNGPKPENIKRSLYLLFGLPVAQEDTTVTAIDTTAMTIQTTSADGRVRTFTIPGGLEAEVSVGDFITRFTPLVSGITVYDKINRPGFIAELIGRPGIQRFLLDSASRGVDPSTDESKLLRVLEENTFLPQIDVEAFVRSDINLSNVRTFLSSIQPLTKTYLFQIITGNFTDSLAMSEFLRFGIGINVTPNVDANQTTWTDQNLQSYEINPNSALDLDSDGALLTESIEVEVYQASVLIDSFIA